MKRISQIVLKVLLFYFFMGPCCELGAKLNDEKQVLYQTDNFFVAPAIGPIGIEGYVLVLPKKCYNGVGNIPEELHTELEEVTQTTTKVLRETYGVNSQIFEHGPKVAEFRGGSCLDHAHLHVVPGVNIMEDIAVDLIHRVNNPGLFYRVNRVEGFRKAVDIIHEKKFSYLIAESPNGERIIIEINFRLPSQYMRKIIAKNIGSEKWDWAASPDLEIVDKTIDRLHNKFG